MKNIIKTLIIGSLVSINSCSSNIKKYSYDIYYNMNMEVAKDKNKKETAEVKRKLYIYDDEKTLKYNDQYIETEWSPVKDGFWFLIKNKTDGKIKINWENAFFADGESGSYKIKKSNLDDYSRESVILPESFYENYILPYGNSKEKYFPAKVLTNERNQEKKISKVINMLKDKLEKQSVQILLPIEIDGVIHDYRFLFSFNEIGAADRE